MNLEIHDFVVEPDKLQRIISESNLSIVPSWHEGFGLTAWESIASATPLILSKNSGVYHLLEHIGGEVLGCIIPIEILGSTDAKPNEKDVDTLSSALVAVAADLPKATNNAKSLLELITRSRDFTWTGSAYKFAACLGVETVASPFSLQIFDKGQRLSLEHDIGVDHLRRLIQVVEYAVKSGDYLKAIRLLTDIHSHQALTASPSMAIEVTLLEAETLLRLNRYQEALKQCAIASEYAIYFQMFDFWVQAKAITNTILRDQGMHAEATLQAQSLLANVEVLTEKTKQKVYRIAARSLALDGQGAKGVEFAKMAQLAISLPPDIGSQAKALFAEGDCYRHSSEFEKAIIAYEDSINLSLKSGEVDCYLWACLGLADAAFLCGKSSQMEEELKRLKNYLGSPASIHPLETMHHRFIELSALFVSGEDVTDAVDELMGRYDSIGVTWPRSHWKVFLTGARVAKPF